MSNKRVWTGGALTRVLLIVATIVGFALYMTAMLALCFAFPTIGCVP